MQFGPALVLCAALVCAGAASAQEPEAPPLDFQQGPGTFAMHGDLAEIELTDSYVFLDGDNTRKLLELTQNPSSGGEIGTVLPRAEGEGWFVIFEWDEIGYVGDEDEDLDAAAILSSIEQGTAHANEERTKRGWPMLEIVGWHDEPRYDANTNNLTWAIVGSSQGEENINRFVKVLGRKGVMTATLVASRDELFAADNELWTLLSGYHFQSGSSYAEYVPGTDKLAEMGLAALVVGGAGAVLVKSGLLARFWKLIVAGLVGVGGVVSRFFRGTRAEDEPITRV